VLAAESGIHTLIPLIARVKPGIDPMTVVAVLPAA
jgi:hypothetical protein